MLQGRRDPCLTCNKKHQRSGFLPTNHLPRNTGNLGKLGDLLPTTITRRRLVYHRSHLRLSTKGRSHQTGVFTAKRGDSHRGETQKTSSRNPSIIGNMEFTHEKPLESKECEKQNKTKQNEQQNNFCQK